jgi:hypothetical protein
MRPHRPARLGVIAMMAFTAAAGACTGLFTKPDALVGDDLRPVRVASLVEDVTVAVAPLDTMRFRAPMAAATRTSLHDFAATPAAVVPVFALLLMGVAARLAWPDVSRSSWRRLGARAPPRARPA